MSRIVRPAATVEYPSGDGQPMAENDWQLLAIINSVSALQHHYRDHPDVYVSGDLFIYYEEGNPRARVAPDVFVAFGVPSHKRPSYKLWEEGVVPAFVMEVASVSTWREDDGRKAKLYERLGVQEYWQYDPTGEYLGLRLKGRRLVEGAYVPQPVVESLDGMLLLRSETLDLDFRVKGEEMHFFDPATGERLLSRIDQLAARQAAESRAEAAESRADVAESRADVAESRAGAAESRAGCGVAGRCCGVAGRRCEVTGRGSEVAGQGRRGRVRGAQSAARGKAPVIGARAAAVTRCAGGARPARRAHARSRAVRGRG